MVFVRVEFCKHSHLELKSGGHVGGDQTQNRLDFEVKGRFSQEVPESHEIQLNLAVHTCSTRTPAPLLFSQFTLEYAVDGY